MVGLIPKVPVGTAPNQKWGREPAAVMGLRGGLQVPKKDRLHTLTSRYLDGVVLGRAHYYLTYLISMNTSLYNTLFHYLTSFISLLSAKMPSMTVSPVWAVRADGIIGENTSKGRAHASLRSEKVINILPSWRRRHCYRRGTFGFVY